MNLKLKKQIIPYDHLYILAIKSNYNSQLTKLINLLIKKLKR
jgi:hypothetical protein